MRTIRLLDCTLRDGGCVNNFNFGQPYMETILKGLEASGVDIIELGYIDEKAGSEMDRTQYCNEQVISKTILKEKKPGVTYVAMVDYGKFNLDKLMTRSENSIDGIRLAFHKKNRYDMIEWGKKILAKGYQLYIQPMICMRYNDMEILDLIASVNAELPDASAFYIVDSFGEMRHNDLVRVMNLVDNNLSPTMPMGFHAHNNLQMAYSNAVTMLEYRTKRDVIFDASVLGMGKGAGNATTELFSEHLNIYEGKNYNIEPLLDIIDKVLNQIKESYSWGYSVEYYLSACNQCTPSYAGHFYRKHMLSIKQVSELLGMISEEKKLSFDRSYADELYFQYNAKKYDDQDTVDSLRKEFAGKKILLVAPGKSVVSELSRINDYAKQDDVVTIAVNNYPAVECDYILATKKTVQELRRDIDKMILTSNVSTNPVDGLIVNYTVGSDPETGKTDNALFTAINLLIRIGAKEVALAGFDGFTPDVDGNYYDSKLKRPVTHEQAERRNKRAVNFLKSVKDKIAVDFITKSMYQEE